MSNTEQALRELLETVFDGEIDASSLKGTARLQEDAGLNSVAMLYMAVAIEERFGVKLLNSDLPGLTTIDDVVRLIEERRAK